MTVVEQARDLLKGRLTELESERKTIEKTLAAMNGGTAKPGRGRPRKAPPAATGSSRRKRSGTRADQAVKLVEKSPKGISASDIAKAMKIKPNYLYRVLSDLEKEGRVLKKGRTYFPPGK
jgi:DNA invertase Pin-like site-specific DNA recombinase